MKLCAVLVLSILMVGPLSAEEHGNGPPEETPSGTLPAIPGVRPAIPDHGNRGKDRSREPGIDNGGQNSDGGSREEGSRHRGEGRGSWIGRGPDRDSGQDSGGEKTSCGHCGHNRGEGEKPRNSGGQGEKMGKRNDDGPRHESRGRGPGEGRGRRQDCPTGEGFGRGSSRGESRGMGGGRGNGGGRGQGGGHQGRGGHHGGRR